MSLIYCPECGHEISTAAVACPNCGRPINAVPPPDAVIVTPTPRREGFPPWAIIPIGLAGLAFIFFLIYAMSGRDEELSGSNLNVNVSTRRASTGTTTSSSSEPSTVTTIPPSTTTVTTAPSSSSSIPDTQTVNVPGSQTSVPATRGRVVIDAKVTTRSGAAQAVKNEKFYLLDKDVESILNEANIEPIEGQTLSTSLGLAVLYPNEHGTFYREALAAIRRHIKYSGTTDGNGKASFANIEPDSYYLFGITRTGGGFAMWSNPVSIQAGENILNLTPQRITEMSNTSLNRIPELVDEDRDTSE